jgi:hypothetical protein
MRQVRAGASDKCLVVHTRHKGTHRKVHSSNSAAKAVQKIGWEGAPGNRNSRSTAKRTLHTHTAVHNQVGIEAATPACYLRLGYAKF